MSPFNKSRWLTREIMIAEFLAIITIGVLFLVFFVFMRPTTKVSQDTVNNYKNFQIDYWLFKEGYTSPVITIKNTNNIAWENCEMTISENYKKRIEKLAPASSAGDNLIIPVTSFVRDDGRNFNYSFDQIGRVCFVCLQPQYNIYCGKFKSEGSL